MTDDGGELLAFAVTRKKKVSRTKKSDLSCVVSTPYLLSGRCASAALPFPSSRLEPAGVYEDGALNFSKLGIVCPELGRA